MTDDNIANQQITKGVNMQLLIELPEELKVLLAIGVTVIVTEFLKFLGAKFGIDLSGYSAQVTAAVVAAVLVFVNGLLAQIPAEAAPIVQQLLGLLVVVLGSFGAYKVFLSNKAKC